MRANNQATGQTAFRKSFKLIEIFFGFGTMLMFSVAMPTSASFEPAISPGSLISVVNQDRQKYNLPALHESEQLTSAALAKARDILEKDYFAHLSPEGLLPWDFIHDQGFDYQFAGENLAINYTNSFELETAFLNSPHHRDNLLSPLFTDIGVAVVEGEYRGQPAIITVQMFGKPALLVRH